MPFADYFDERARRFASFYRSRPVSRVLGRGALFDRLDFAVETAIALRAQRVLDVGCGSGPLFAPLADAGIVVTGIEPAAAMIDLAEREAARHPGLVTVVPIGWEDIPAWHADQDDHDLAVALGVFDYVPDPETLLGVLAGSARAVVASFPVPGLRTSLRNFRYGRRGVAVYGYSADRVRALCATAGLAVVELRPLGRAGFALHARRHDPSV